MWFVLLTALTAPGAGTLERLIESARALDMVPVDRELDGGGRWCKKGKPVADPAIRELPRVEFSPPEPVGSPRTIREVRLREVACVEWAFRVIVTEWTYGSEAEADRAATAISHAYDNGSRKSLHRLWREGPCIFFADGRAWMHRKRFTKTMKDLGIGFGFDRNG